MNTKQIYKLLQQIKRNENTPKVSSRKRAEFRLYARILGAK